MLPRRVSVRRIVVAVAAVLLLAIAYLQLAQIYPTMLFNAINAADGSFEKAPQATNSAETSNLNDELSQNLDDDPSVVVFPQTPIHVDQEVDFAEMQQLQEYRLDYAESKIGSIYVGFSEHINEVVDPGERENATFFSLVRNSDKVGILQAIESVEDRFNKRYHYDWVFANDEPFDPQLVASIEALVSGNAYFELIPRDFWSYPPWIDVERANATMHYMAQEKIKYGGSELYRHMCRFNSGLFFQLPQMQRYRYYWRVEPEIQFRCDLFDQDWFKYMRENDKKYAFTLAPLELHTTVENLWDTVNQFSRQNPQFIAKDNNMEFLTEDGGNTYNMCHFWSNFEIGDMDFYRLEPYQAFFNHIDQSGGFYYSRWGDAPVHTMAVSLLLPYKDLLFFENSGYFHHPNSDCPHDPEIRSKRRCTCNIGDDFTWVKASCIPKWFEIHNITKPPFVPKYKFENQHQPDESE